MSTTTPPIRRFDLQWRLYGANVQTVLSKAAAIMVAKTFNAAITQSINPATACSESPPGTWSGLFGQLAFVLVTALLVVRTWYRHAHALRRLQGGKEDDDDEEHSPTVWTERWEYRKFAAGEVLGWATKELTAIAVALVAVGLGYERPPEEEEEEEEEGEEGSSSQEEGSSSQEEEDDQGEGEEGRWRFLRDAMQGDAPLTGVIENDWKQVAAYAMYACLLCGVAVVLFGPGLSYWKRLVHYHYQLHRRFIHRWRRWFSSEEEEALLEPEQMDDLAVELATESLKISQAYTLNGTFSGMIAVAIVSSNGGDPDEFSWGAFGLLEVYTIVLLYFGGYLFSRRCCSSSSNLEFLEPLIDFYEDVWGCLAGLALGSIATSPGGILSGLDDHLEGTAADAVRAVAVSGLALGFLFHGAHIRVYETFCGCTPRIDAEMAQQTADFFIAAASLAFAWAWEDFTHDVVCEELPKLGLQNEVAAVWINFAVLAAVLIPISIFFSLQAQKAMVPVQRDLDRLFGKDATAQKEGGQKAPPLDNKEPTSCEFVMEQVEDIVTEVEI